MNRLNPSRAENRAANERNQPLRPGSLLLRLEEAQQLARGLLSMLSDAYTATQQDSHAAIGVSVNAQRIAEMVAHEWDALEAAWAEARSTDASRLETIASLPAKVGAAFENLVGFLEHAATCVYTLAMAVKSRCAVGSLVHGGGLAEGFAEFADHWAGEILEPGDMWKRPGEYGFSVSASAAQPSAGGAQ